MVNIGVYLPKSTAGADMVMVICLPLIIVSNAMDFVGMDPPVIGLVYVYDDSILLAGCPKRWKVPVASTVLYSAVEFPCGSFLTISWNVIFFPVYLYNFILVTY